MNNIAEYVRYRIRQLRNEKGVSARDMSLSLGQNQAYIQKIETGQALPSFDGLSYICDYFQIPVQVFFDGDVSSDIKRLFDEAKKMDKDTLLSLVEIAQVLNSRH